MNPHKESIEFKSSKVSEMPDEMTKVRLALYDCVDVDELLDSALDYAKVSKEFKERIKKQGYKVKLILE